MSGVRAGRVNRVAYRVFLGGTQPRNGMGFALKHYKSREKKFFAEAQFALFSRDFLHCGFCVSKLRMPDSGASMMRIREPRLVGES